MKGKNLRVVRGQSQLIYGPLGSMDVQLDYPFEIPVKYGGLSNPPCP